MTTREAGPPDIRVEELRQHLAAYRLLRAELEQAILPLASSLDGLTFEFQASLHGLPYRCGGYVVLESPSGWRLGRVETLEMSTYAAAAEVAPGAGTDVTIRFARGGGTVLEADGASFHDAHVRPAIPDEVASWLATRTRAGRAGLTIGEYVTAPGVPATLDSGGLTRHTFVCGQSGSGKTYTLGLLLERVLAETAIRVVVLDPNSDYVGLGAVLEGADPGLAERYAHVADEVAVWSDNDNADHLLRLRFAELDPSIQAAVLGLDPIADREEYAELIELLEAQRRGTTLLTAPEELLTAESPDTRRLGQRATNLGVLGWRVWERRAPSLLAALRSREHRCTIVDLGSLDTVGEQRLVAQAVLASLWEQRAERVPCLLVVDEAHNILPAQPDSALTRLSTERAVQIAAEGRKYGLHLLCSTQQPHKVHENVVSQCDNLVLMRMNSRADIADLMRFFSFVPDGLMSRVTTFGMGEALVAGRLMPEPGFVRMGRRITREGGTDVSVAWAAPRRPG
ncbi:MAG: hypothetical protein QOK15_2612 [Nocardioidaceae bacterium]|jgi:hypothetical protein|nr:hypothetical protein [Nocardioidaceae bacterium]